MPRVTEFDARPIDVHGDAVDIYTFRTLAQAMAQARALAPHYPAVVVERHRMQVNEHEQTIEHSDYDVVWLTGCKAALAAGCWKI